MKLEINYNTCILCMKFKRDYNMQNLMYTPRDRLIVVNSEKGGSMVLLNHDLHSNIINYYRYSRLAFAHV
jgi:hypothetical protein